MNITEYNAIDNAQRKGNEVEKTHPKQPKLINFFGGITEPISIPFCQ